MMKNIKRFSAITLIGAFIMLFNACNDDSELFTISTPTPAVLANVGFTDLKLDAVNINNPAITLNWQEANYGRQASINYAVQFSKDNAFTNPITTSTITGITAVTLSVSEVNSGAGSAGLNPFEWKSLFIRVVSSLGSRASEQIASNTIEINVYPFFNYPFNDFYLVGDATAPGWNNNSNNPPVYRDPVDSNLYYYTGRFSDGGYFKLLETKGLWQPQWGTNDGAKIEVNPGNASDPERFPSAGGAAVVEGFYTFTVNFSTKTFTFNSFNAAGITSPASLSLQGSSTTNVAMTQLVFDGHQWFANGVRLTPGNVEFVTGTGAKWGSTTSFSGIATDGGGAIPVIAEDDYDVWFNDLTGRYILIPLNL